MSDHNLDIYQSQFLFANAKFSGVVKLTDIYEIILQYSRLASEFPFYI